MNVVKPDFGVYQERIKYLQRAELDEEGLQVTPGEIEASRRTAFELTEELPIWLIEVQGISHFWPAESLQRQDIGYLTRDILAGLGSQAIPVYFVIRGTSKHVRLYIGTIADVQEYGTTIRATLNSYYPGIRLWPEKELSEANQEEQAQISKDWNKMHKDVQQELRSFIHGCQYTGLVTGVPTPNVGVGTTAGTQIDRLIRGLYGADWLFMVLADPVEDLSVAKMQLSLLQELLRVEQEEAFREQRESAGQSIAIYYHQLLQLRHQFLEECLYEGGWLVQSYVCSPDLATYRRAKGLVKSILSGDLSRLDRVRVLDCFNAAPKVSSFQPIVIERRADPSYGLLHDKDVSFKYHSLLSSSQLTALIHLPRVEMPGYYVHESVAFDVSSHVPLDTNSITLGEILDRGQSTGNFYRVPLQELNKHCLLVGITGSGKTNTAKFMFQQLQQRKPEIPILVIEPAKREYRELLGMDLFEEKLHVFTVGEETSESAPFRLNPFEIRRGVSVQTHIDLLKSVFNASFGMWTPLPQVMERAIHEIYQDKGWDIVQGINERAASQEAEQAEWYSFVQPTLTDLFNKIGELVPRLGYPEEVERNVRTALETRINSLRIGGKGLMLDTRKSIPIEHLLTAPTILELEGVGDDDEKAFLIGLILMAIYEYLRVQGPQNGSELQHITIVEEAHRLLTNMPISTDPEASNLKSKAVETFVNMLSEVRAFGEGFVIAEQIPVKLAPDVIKNTGLKIMHRIVSIDDRQVMGGAMNVNEQQLRELVSLGVGEAVVHGGGKYGDDNPILIRVPPAKDTKKLEPASVNKAVRRNWEEFVKQKGLKNIFGSYPSCQSYCTFPKDEQAVQISHPYAECSITRRTAENPEVEDAFAAFILSFIVMDKPYPFLTELYPRFSEVLFSHITDHSSQQAQIRCILTHSLYSHMQKRGAQYGWNYEEVFQMTEQLLPAVLSVATNRDLDSETQKSLSIFCQEFKTHCRLTFEPFYGCRQNCKQLLCLYRYNIEPLMQDDILDSNFKSSGGDWEKVAIVSEEGAVRALSSLTDSTAIQQAAICFAIQKTHSDRSVWPSTARRFIIDGLLDHYSKKGEAQ